MKGQTAPCFRPRPRWRWVTPEAYPYLGLGLLLVILSLYLRHPYLALCFAVLTLYIAYFFRNPRRPVPGGPEYIVAPADGRILAVQACEENNYLKTAARRVSIFMSPLNCHLNRAPVDGTVEACFYRRGSFRAAFRPKAMERNEHHAIVLKDARGTVWLVVQIAGWLARRIVSYVRPGDQLAKGERLGLIQFGSRTDLYCPPDVEILVTPGQKVFGGKTIIGRIRCD